MIKHLFSFFLVVSASAQQTCPSGGNGPCRGGACETTAEVCLPDGNCCDRSELSTPCVDKLNPNTGVSDCPRMASYCTNSAYLELMKDQCPKTCGYCTGTGGPPSTGGCVDKLNPTTGASDCPMMACYCTYPPYRQLMTEECPRTCGFC